MTYAVATTSEHMRDMRLDESWTGRIWDDHSGNANLDWNSQAVWPGKNTISSPVALEN